MEFIEAAFGRIKLFGGIARTVLNEHFVLKAVKAFFFIKAILYSWPMPNEQCCTRPMPRCMAVCGRFLWRRSRVALFPLILSS